MCVCVCVFVCVCVCLCVVGVADFFRWIVWNDNSGFSDFRMKAKNPKHLKLGSMDDLP